MESQPQGALIKLHPGFLSSLFLQRNCAVPVVLPLLCLCKMRDVVLHHAADSGSTIHYIRRRQNEELHCGDGGDVWALLPSQQLGGDRHYM